VSNSLQQVEDLLGLSVEDKLVGRYFSYKNTLYRIVRFRTHKDYGWVMECTDGNRTKFIYLNDCRETIQDPELVATANTRKLLYAWGKCEDFNATG